MAATAEEHVIVKNNFKFKQQKGTYKNTMNFSQDTMQWSSKANFTDTTNVTEIQDPTLSRYDRIEDNSTKSDHEN